ncbi:DUF2254 domain-containing protein [Frankia sp. QA3]|uniref:DUF2254 domain-containing protein n=1 Tax=Frankia sp. QA3 TaxID=710111 RepID=UPI000269BF18|nr:DUF2254 domain-containing protein [Frankia sp. QA3]EIV91481.1 putative membrane protein [Frankia sp. QA3]
MRGQRLWAGRAVRTYAYRFRESLFFLPAVLVVVAIGAAQGLLAIDRRHQGWQDGLPLTFRMSAGAAQTFLSVLAAATITVAATVFSLTVVSLQLASSQFSPRVLHTFIRDRFSQSVVGVLVAVFTFSVLVLRDVRTDADPPYSPSLSTGVTVLLAIASVVLIVGYLDHLTRSLQVGRVLHTIGRETKAVIAASARPDPTLAPAPADAPDLRVRPGGVAVVAADDGWIRQAGTAALLAALPPGAALLLRTRVGAFVVEGQHIATLWLPGDASAGEPAPAVDDEAVRTVRAVLARIDVGVTRTMQEDVDFGLRQMTDIALRALSAAINDPTTAVEAILRIGGVLRHLLAGEPPPDVVAGPAGRLLCRAWELDPAEYVGHAFDQLRHAGVGHPAVCVAMLRTLRLQIWVAERHGRHAVVPALRRQMDLLLDAVATAPGLTEADRDAVHAAADAATDSPHHGMGARPRNGPAGVAVPAGEWGADGSV